MALPTNVSYGTVTGRFLLAYADSSDVEPQPDGEPAKGFVIFTASPVKLLDATATPAPVTILPAPVVANLNADGYIEGYTGDAGVRLVATNDADLNPVNWTWQVDFRLTDEADVPLTVPSFSFELPAGSTTDLTTVSPVPNANGTFYIIGPQGIQGIQGIQGPPGSLGNLSGISPVVYNTGTNQISLDQTAMTIVSPALTLSTTTSTVAGRLARSGNTLVLGNGSAGLVFRDSSLVDGGSA
jgi:hypothetical protein